MYESGRVVGAVCHGPVAITKYNIVNRKKPFRRQTHQLFTEAEENLDKHTLGDVIPFMLDEELISKVHSFHILDPLSQMLSETETLSLVKTPLPQYL